MTSTPIVTGVDIGGSHITAAQVHLEKRLLVPGTLTRNQVNSKEKVNSIIEAWSKVINKSFCNDTCYNQKIGIAMPGPFDYESGISLMKGQDKFDELYGLNIKNLLAEALHINAANIRFINDAESFIRGEVFNGAAKGSDCAIGLTLGTGLGSSIYENGNSKDANLWCSPFKDGIAEDYLSTRWFTNRYNSLSGKQVKDVKELVDRKTDEPLVREVFNEFGKNLATFLKDFIDLKKPDVVVIGGNIAKAYDLFAEELHKNMITNTTKTSIKKAVLGEEAALIGAATCWC